MGVEVTLAIHMVAWWQLVGLRWLRERERERERERKSIVFGSKAKIKIKMVNDTFLLTRLTSSRIKNC